MRRTLPRVSLGTVYRNLDKLREQGRLRVVRLEGGLAHYDAMIDAHDHFVCERCGAVRRPARRAAHGSTSRPLRAAGYDVHWHTTALYGAVQARARAGTARRPRAAPRRAAARAAQAVLMDLPTLVPLFPLPNAVLFPGVPLPLHIFEPRYREMVRDAERSEERLIGMVLLRGEWRKDYYGTPGDLSDRLRRPHGQRRAAARRALQHSAARRARVHDRRRAPRAHLSPRARSSGARRRRAACRPSCARASTR